MSTVTLDQPIAGPVLQGSAPISIPLLRPDSHPYLLINTPGERYRLEFPIVGSPIIEDNKIIARFIVDDNVYLDLKIVGQSIESENKFTGQFSLFYQIEQRRPRAHFVADTLMAVIGLAGRFDLEISKPKVSTNLNFELQLLEISKMLCRRQMSYRLMVIEKATGKQFLLPSAISKSEIEGIAFVYHAIADRSFVWHSGKMEFAVPATQEKLALLLQSEQPFNISLEPHSFSETVLGESISLGSAKIVIVDAVLRNLNEVRRELEKLDGRLVNVTIESLSGQVRYEFQEAPCLSDKSWEEKIQRLIDLEDQLDTALIARYHALAASTLEGLTEEEKAEITMPSNIGEAFLIDDSKGDNN